MYVIATGTVQLHKKRRILAELGFGACVGQAALLQYSLYAGTHVSSATALKDCILLSISREDLDALIKVTPQVSRGVLNAVASSFQLLYFEPLRAIAESGSIPQPNQIVPSTAEDAHSNSKVDPVLKITEFLSANMKAALSVDRAAKSFLYNVGRSRRVTPLALARERRGRRHSFSNSQSMERSLSSGTLAFRGLHAFSDPVEYTTLEKSIHLKSSHLMRNLDGDKVSLVAQISRVLVFSHGDVLYSSGTKVDCVYVIINGTMEIMNFQSDPNAVSASISIKLHDGDCFGEEAFVTNATTQGECLAVGRCTLFEITAKELVDLMPPPYFWKMKKRPPKTQLS
ncbi:unnamed protein product [Peronospora belbahrii]|uniref:Cyclic nucleotide-binding domain-containing protein n=1 Tax=Peronospora belbahrii TaxID=622444 RepID=A0ABN8D3R9_9STRA|nr:unnamed protein product [Peronospora belbahrii]